MKFLSQDLRRTLFVILLASYLDLVPVGMDTRMNLAPHPVVLVLSSPPRIPSLVRGKSRNHYLQKIKSRPSALRSAQDQLMDNSNAILE